MPTRRSASPVRRRPPSSPERAPTLAVWPGSVACSESPLKLSNAQRLAVVGWIALIGAYIVSGLLNTAMPEPVGVKFCPMNGTDMMWKP